MGVFDTMLREGESLFKNSVALDFDFVPKLIPYREREQRHIAACIRPLFEKRTGRNLIVSGSPGVGKTLGCRKVLEELEEKTDDIVPFYVNCWKRNTSYKVMLEFCELLGYQFTQNKNTEDLFKVVKSVLNQKSAVIVFDEIDKIEDLDVLYLLLEEVYRKSIILITNDREWASSLDSRIMSRLIPDAIVFEPYSLAEAGGILEQRKQAAFVDDVWMPDAFALVARKAFEAGDLRAGLFLLRESGQLAEDASSRKVTHEHASRALERFDRFSIKSTESLGDEGRRILEIIKKNDERRIGDLFKAYLAEGGTSTYKTFQRSIKKLEEDRFISCRKISGGAEGMTTIISLANKRLSDF
ncbi:MAG TPA: AAA family ATPase [Candidatus Nanoarchaeia archaeon]|nr:AAA family ATPase [Candidatus Nanoarchaeia archaeon]